MPKGGCPLTPAQIPPFQLPAQGPSRPRNTGRGLRPPAPGLALLHVQTVTTAHGFQVLAEKPRVLSAEAPLWGMSPEPPAGGQRDRPPLQLGPAREPRTPPHGTFQSLPKGGQHLDFGDGQPCPFPTQPPCPQGAFVRGRATASLLALQPFPLAPFTDEKAEAQRGLSSLQGPHSLPLLPHTLSASKATEPDWPVLWVCNLKPEARWARAPCGAGKAGAGRDQVTSLSHCSPHTRERTLRMPAGWARCHRAPTAPAGSSHAAVGLGDPASRNPPPLELTRTWM